jgi:peptide-methionine (S)-S-oxide reductase
VLIGLLPGSVQVQAEQEDAVSESAKVEYATFGSGCFWCTEAFFETMEGVLDVVSGYSNGDMKDPNYRAVCSGKTGHAEVVRVKFDPARVSYEALLDQFWKTHDPTTLNRQGADVGTQYRSGIFYNSDEQRKIAEASKENVADNFKDPIVTEIVEAGEFYPAEDYHQDYFRNNPNAPYSRFIQSKLDKLK